MQDNNPYYYNRSKEAIKCAGLGCTNDSTSTLKIRYLNKSGHFCESCKNELMKSDLIIFSENQRSIDNK